MNKQWLTNHLCLPGWDKLYHSVAQPAAPNLWRPLPDGSGLTLLNFDSAPWSDWRLVFEWIKHLTDHIFPQYGLRLQGEVWYQGEHSHNCIRSMLGLTVTTLCHAVSVGEEALDTGRLYAGQNGVIERQTVKLCPGVAGAAARNDVAMLHSLSAEQAAAQDGFGRTACMHAALFNSWAVLKQLLLQPRLINWEHRQTEQASFLPLTQAEAAHDHASADVCCNVLSRCD